ncbi:hypothetical protein FRC12_017804 [Ceratobasidium sp. 428]|nr:hypothetical protein FRC12_017804 [Ceratobasidium sp. 428]
MSKNPRAGSSRKWAEDDAQGTTKKRKVENGLAAKKSIAGSQPLADSQGSSFVEILEQFEEGDKSAEGGRNLWPRPELKNFDPKKNSISTLLPFASASFLNAAIIAFQQIDIEEFPDSAGTVIRLFGVTEASFNRF